MRTRDDVIICCHDEWLDRLTGRHVKVSETDFADLPPYKSQIRDDFEDFTYTITSKDDTTWLRLDKLFANMPRNIIYSVDLKDAYKSTVNLVHDIITT